MLTPVAIREIKPADLNEIIELQGRVWKEYFLSEYGRQVPAVNRTKKNLLYYLDKEPHGCFLGELDGRIIGAIYSHVWGKVGWFGPLEVASEWQGQGVGKSLVAKSVQFLKSRQCETIGLETMAGSSKNVAFYSKMAFKPKAFSYVLFKKLGRTEGIPTPIELRAFEVEKDVKSAMALWNSIQPGLDYEVEFRAVKTDNLGCALLLDTEQNLAHAIVHTYEMFQPSENAIIKLIVASKGQEHAVETLLNACEAKAAEAGKTGIFVRKYATTPPDANFFFKRGYILQSTSIRMILQGNDEAGDNTHVSCWSG